jgi:hypothetical protein
MLSVNDLSWLHCAKQPFVVYRTGSGAQKHLRRLSLRYASVDCLQCGLGFDVQLAVPPNEVPVVYQFP